VVVHISAPGQNAQEDRNSRHDPDLQGLESERFIGLISMADSRGEVSLLLAEMRSGHKDALARLLPLVYNELRRLAGRYMRDERPGHTLQPTALVHEAYAILRRWVTPMKICQIEIENFRGIAHGTVTFPDHRPGPAQVNCLSSKVFSWTIKPVRPLPGSRSKSRGRVIPRVLILIVKPGYKLCKAFRQKFCRIVCSFCLYYRLPN
jgi:hypothetical protein